MMLPISYHPYHKYLYLYLETKHFGKIQGGHTKDSSRLLSRIVTKTLVSVS